MIRALEEQLNIERNVQKEMTDKFKEQLRELEDEKLAIERMKKATVMMEKKQQDRDYLQSRQSRQMEEELDMVPTKQKSARSNASNNNKWKKINSSSSMQSFRPERVKSSIPKVASSKKQLQKEPSTKFLQELQQQEVERAVQQHNQQLIETQVLTKLRDHPNEHLNDLQSEVALLNRKVEPLLKRVEEAARNIAYASEKPQFKQGPVSMLSKMGGRLINFYADDIADLMLEDFLAETALELQRMEQNALKDYSGEEAK